MQNSQTQQAENDLRKLAELRAELEMFAVRQIVQRSGPTEEISRRLLPILTQLREATRKRDYAAFEAADFHLHESLVQLADLPVLQNLWNIVWNALAAFHRDSLQVYWPDLRVLMDEHEYLVAAICAREVITAQDGVRSHLQAIWFRIAERQGDIAKEQDPLQRATAYLAFHLHREIRLHQVARKIAFVSSGHLSKLFRDRYDMSFQAYLQKLRLAMARDLLLGSSLRIAQIARRVGYRDVSRFGQHFKRAFAMTPNAWRKRRGQARSRQGLTKR